MMQTRLSLAAFENITIKAMRKVKENTAENGLCHQL